MSEKNGLPDGARRTNPLKVAVAAVSYVASFLSPASGVAEAKAPAAHPGPFAVEDPIGPEHNASTAGGKPELPAGVIIAKGNPRKVPSPHTEGGNGKAPPDATELGEAVAYEGDVTCPSLSPAATPETNRELWARLAKLYPGWDTATPGSKAWEKLPAEVQACRVHYDKEREEDRQLIDEEKAARERVENSFKGFDESEKEFSNQLNEAFELTKAKLHKEIRQKRLDWDELTMPGGERRNPDRQLDAVPNLVPGSSPGFREPSTGVEDIPPPQKKDPRAPETPGPAPLRVDPRLDGIPSSELQGAPGPNGGCVSAVSEEAENSLG